MGTNRSQLLKKVRTKRCFLHMRMTYVAPNVRMTYVRESLLDQKKAPTKEALILSNYRFQFFLAPYISWEIFAP